MKKAIQKLKNEFLRTNKGKIEHLDPLSLEAVILYIEFLEKALIAERKAKLKDSPVVNGSILTLKALEIYGLTEISGKIADPLIVEMFAVSGHPNIKSDEIAWCSAFMCWLCVKNGFESTQKLNARSWLSLSDEIDEKNVQIGDILIFWRVSPDDWRGHVGLYIGETETHYYVLGGNQSNCVKISKYPKKELLGIRRPKRI